MKRSSGQKEFRFLYPAGFFPSEFRKIFEDSREISMNKYILKQTAFLKSFRWTWGRQLSKRWHFLVKKIKVCPSKSEDDYQSVSKKIFHLRKLSSGRTSWLQSWLPCRKQFPKSETVLFNQLRIIQTFFKFFVLQMILWTRRVQHGQTWRKMFAKSQVLSFDVPNWFQKVAFSKIVPQDYPLDT